MPISVVGDEDRGMLVRAPAQLLCFDRAGSCSELVQLFGGPRRAFALQRLDQRDVAGEHVVPGERRRLVGDLVGLERRGHEPRGYVRPRVEPSRPLPPGRTVRFSGANASKGASMTGTTE